MNYLRPTIIGLLALAVALAGVLSAGASPGTTTRVSVDSTGNQGNASSFQPAISPDGRFVAFASSASNLVSGDTNGDTDIFVHDRQTGATERVSVDSAGNQGNSVSGLARPPALSADGRFVAFWSFASNLVAGDTNGEWDVFVHDRQTGVTERVSVDSAGNEVMFGGFPLLNILSAALSADGRFVAFPGFASNLVAGDTNGDTDIFVHDRQTGATTRVSVDSTGNQGNGGSLTATLSADGRFVAFWSSASNLVAGDTNSARDVFVHDRQTDATERVSVHSAGDEGNGNSIFPAISADGRFVTFPSAASNLVTGDTNGKWDVFVHDRQTGATERVSLDSVGNEANDDSDRPAISGDGRFVAFDSAANNLVAGKTNRLSDTFVRDRDTDADGIFDESGAVSTTRVSVDSAGNEGNDDSIIPAISGDGRYVAFESFASNLVAADTNGDIDIFVHDRGTGSPDADLDGFPDAVDNCPGAPNPDQADLDGDGLGDACDTEGPSPNTSGLGGADDCVDGVDNDGDGLIDAAEPVCDTDGDGVSDAADSCPNTPEGETVDANGCSASQLDDDNDGVSNADDLCPGTAADVEVDENGCSALQVDSDGDGVCDPGTTSSLCAGSDNCPDVPNSNQTDSDGDGVGDACDDSDGDGVVDADDQCPGTPQGESVNENGCSTAQLGIILTPTPTPTPTPATPTPTPTPAALGAVQLPDTGGEPSSSAGGADGWRLVLLGTVAAGAIALAAGGWYARKRFRQRRI